MTPTDRVPSYIREPINTAPKNNDFEEFSEGVDFEFADNPELATDQEEFPHRWYDHNTGTEEQDQFDTAYESGEELDDYDTDSGSAPNEP